MVVMVGIDVHKDTHCAVAIDEVGAQLGPARTFRATDVGCLQLLAGRTVSTTAAGLRWCSLWRTAGI